MSAPRSSTEYATGVSHFLDFAAENVGMRTAVLCPCRKCSNRYWLSGSEVTAHLVWNGFMHGYTTWVFHGENHVEPGLESEDLNECQ